MTQATQAKNLALTVPEHNGLAATELRPWGSFTILEEGHGYKIKRIEVKPGHRLSLQMHHHRSEHWIVIAGIAKVQRNEEETMLSTNESTYVPRFTSHRLENPGMVPLVLIEVQNGEYLGEDDIVRFDDDYARENN
ncbi:MAG: phosphomannose isomerase type II C-terminal cupin domain [Cyanobacteria bacterium P01_A01_bin.17]